MNTTLVNNSETIVRVLFPKDMIVDGLIIPAAFRLRSYKQEGYISVFRQSVDSFTSDIRTFDKGRNLPCASMNTGEIRTLYLSIGNLEAKYDVIAYPSPTVLSHGGIVVFLNGEQLQGGCEADLIRKLKADMPEQMLLLAIRKELVKLAQKGLSTVDAVTN